MGLPAYPSYPFPTVPPGFAESAVALEHDRAWLFLQADDLDAAEVGFTRALSGSQSFTRQRQVSGLLSYRVGRWRMR